MTKRKEASSVTENFELQNYLRRCYIWERRHYDYRYKGKRGLSNYVPGGHWDGYRGRSSIWPKLARFFTFHDFPPHEFIAHQFGTMESVFGKPPYPNQVMGGAAIEQHELGVERELGKLELGPNYWGDFIKRKHYSSKRALAYRKAPPSDEQVLQSVLLCPSEVPPVYRYVKAHGLGFSDVTAQLSDSAAMYYMRAKTAYDIAWGDYITEEVKLELEDSYWKILEEIPGL